MTTTLERSFSHTYGLGCIGRGTGIYTPSPGAKTETLVVREIVKALTFAYADEGIVIINIHGGGYQRSGIPDLYVAIRGQSVWIEVKRPGADTTALQRKKMEDLMRVGQFVGTAESGKTAVAIVEQVINTRV